MVFCWTHSAVPLYDSIGRCPYFTVVRFLYYDSGISLLLGKFAGYETV